MSDIVIKPDRGRDFYYGGFSYEQRGVLPRRHLARACELLGEGRQSEVWDLLVPFEDGMEVRRG